MPARDFYHETVKNVLIKDGWTITHDPFPLRYGIRRLYADLGAEKLFAAVKASRKIVVKVKSFSGPSEVTDLQEALGAYGMYRHILADTYPGWELYLAVPQDAYYSVFSEPLVVGWLSHQRLPTVSGALRYGEQRIGSMSRS